MQHSLRGSWQLWKKKISEKPALGLHSLTTFLFELTGKKTISTLRDSEVFRDCTSLQFEIEDTEFD